MYCVNVCVLVVVNLLMHFGMNDLLNLIAANSTQYDRETCTVYNLIFAKLVSTWVNYEKQTPGNELF